MKMLFLLIALMGLSDLFLIYYLLPPKEISSINQTIIFLDNQKIKTSGSVVSERQYGSYKTMLLDNGILLRCNNPCKSRKNEFVYVEAILTKYDDRVYLTIESIKP